MSWETVIGLEVHAQLSTNTKLFSSASVEKVVPEPNKYTVARYREGKILLHNREQSTGFRVVINSPQIF